jgi:Fungal specific transcription factor domain
VTPNAARALEDDEESHFVGDLNPKGIFLAATSPTGSAEPDSVGVWFSRRPPHSLKDSYSRIPLRQSRSSSIYSPDPLISNVLLPYLEDQCLRLLPKPPDFEGLSRIYFDEVHPIFPVLEREAFIAMPESSPAKVLLKQAICLAASTNKHAKTFLSLPTNTTPSRSEFAEQLLLALRTSLDLGFVKDKLVSIQVLALLSLFTQLSDDRNLSAELNSRAVTCIHTTGLHLQNANRKDSDSMTRLFCCVWAVDRLNAAFHGRPVLMHERDFGRDLKACFAQQESCFQLFLRTVLLLDQVIDLYRPISGDSSVSWEGSFPAFEDLLHISGAFRVTAHLVGKRKASARDIMI